MILKILAVILIMIPAGQALAQACPADDAPCLRRSLLEQAEKADLYKQGMEFAERIAAEEKIRGDRWKKTAEEVAPKPPSFWQSPGVWLGVGLVLGVVAGAAVAVGSAYAINPAIVR